MSVGRLPQYSLRSLMLAPVWIFFVLNIRNLIDFVAGSFFPWAQFNPQSVRLALEDQGIPYWLIWRHLTPLVCFVDELLVVALLSVLLGTVASRYTDTAFILILVSLPVFDAAAAVQNCSGPKGRGFIGFNQCVVAGFQGILIPAMLLLLLAMLFRYYRRARIEIGTVAQRDLLAGLMLLLMLVFAVAVDTGTG
ncbi:hypothetical protein Q31b_58400 [Novipirellula aureliae]|uniref:Uncharacterized protein n=1 Tax=Novipirellula aureliae TaxID=2527966 RepID=A0A5C6D6J1_9BACT|nr:hypothetical protein [Novipirellula aureliae]TWU32440.1 hypothetical protein Q31b_58400 [Novipirellula aureliae]